VPVNPAPGLRLGTPTKGYATRGCGAIWGGPRPFFDRILPGTIRPIPFCGPLIGGKPGLSNKAGLWIPTSGIV
jgi:hypothetical protein